MALRPVPLPVHAVALDGRRVAVVTGSRTAATLVDRTVTTDEDGALVVGARRVLATGVAVDARCSAPGCVPLVAAAGTTVLASAGEPGTWRQYAGSRVHAQGTLPAGGGLSATDGASVLALTGEGAGSR